MTHHHCRASSLLTLLWLPFLILGFHAPAATPVVDVIGNLSASDYSTWIAPQSYRDWGNEPSIAVNPLDPQQIIISTFGYGSWVSSSTAQLWYSTNGGSVWTICFSMPTPNGSSVFLDDQSFAYDSSGVLHCALLGESSSGAVYHGVTTNVYNSSAWTWNSAPVASDTSSSAVDQPWIAISGNAVAVAYDNFNTSFSASEERVAISSDNGVTFPAGMNQPVCSPGRVTTSFVNPGLRVAADRIGDFFILCGVRTNNDLTGVPLVNYRLNRFSAGGVAWDFTAATPDAIGGLFVTNGPSRQGNSSTFSFGGINNLIGNITALAVNTNGTRLYVVYGLSDASAIGHLYLQKFQPSGPNLIKSGPPLILSSANASAALPCVAVADNGAVGVLFHEFDGTTFHIHLAVSFNEGSTIATNTELYSFSTNGMVFGYGTTPSSHNRLLGDFGRMIANGNVLYGSFAARGNVVNGSIVTTNFISPFFFSQDVSIARPVILDIVRLANSVRIDFAGTPGATYFVQANTNLLQASGWQAISTNTADTTGKWSYSEPTTSFPRRFFRAALAP